MVRASRPEYALHSSLGLQALCQTLGEAPACDLLELGPARSENLEFWSRFNPWIYIADLRSSLPLPDQHSESSEFVDPDWERLMGLPENRTYNVILAWDLLNYLELPAVSSLIRYLSRYCRPGTMLFTLVFDQKQMPEEISLYHIADDSHLRYETLSPPMRACPRHQPRALAGIMAGFQTRESFRLRNGVVEYLFEFEGVR
jgi:hypothetical protein